MSLSLLFAFTLMYAYYILRPLRDAMSSDWTDAELSFLWTLTFVFSTIAVAIWGAAVARVRIGRLLPGVYIFFGLTFVGFYGLVQFAPQTPSLNEAFYVWISVFALFQMSVFWSFISDIYTKKQALRVFAIIATGSIVGSLFGSVTVLLLIDTLGRPNLLLLSAALLLIPIAVIPALERIKQTLRGAEKSTEDEYKKTIGGNPFAGFTLLIKCPYLLGIALFIFLYTAIGTFVYFELKNLAVVFDPAERAKVWAGMDTAVSILAIFTGLFITGRVASRFGLALTLALVPVVIVIGLLVLAMAPIIGVAVALQVVRRAGNFAITRPGREMLFTHVDRETRFKAKSVIDVVVYRGGDTVNAWAFTGLTQGLGMSLGAVAAVGAGIAAVWAVVAIFLGRIFHRDSDEQESVNS